MKTIEELETAVVSLSDEEYREFRRWFLERDWEAWDRQIEEDSKSGRLDFLVREAAEAKKGGRLKDLRDTDTLALSSRGISRRENAGL